MPMRIISKNTFEAIYRLGALGPSLFLVSCLFWQTICSKHLKFGTNTQFDMLKMILMRYKPKNTPKAIYRLGALGPSLFSIVCLLQQMIRSKNLKLAVNTKFDMLKTMPMRKISKNTFEAIYRIRALGPSLFLVSYLFWQTMCSR